MNKQLLFIFSIPFAILSLSSLTSCSNQAQIIDNIRDDYVNKQYNAIAPKIAATEFNKKFKHGDIIEMTITDKQNNENTVVLPYVTEYAEAGYYGSCLCDESDGSHAGRPEKDYVNISFAMHPFSSKTESFLSGKVVFTMYKKEGFKAKMEAANCTNKLTLEQLAYDTLAYANFRDVTEIGDFKNIIKPSVMYRGCSPINSGTTGSDRYYYANDLLENYKIELDVCLNTSYKTYDKYGKLSGVAGDINKFIDQESHEIIKNEYICNKFKGTNDDWANINNFTEDKSYMCCVPLSTDFYTSGNNGPLFLCGKVFDSISKLDKSKPFYLHCEEGKDRTGFICAVLEALAASEKGSESNSYLDSIVADFMLSYKNYFNVTLAQDINRYQDIADLTIYRHIYGLCLGEKAASTFKDENFNWLAHNSIVEVKKMLTDEEGKNLHAYAEKYVTMALKEFYTYTAPSEVEGKTKDALYKIKRNICLNEPDPPSR